MIIVAITDIHGHIGLIEKITDIISSADYIIVSGDITHFGNENDASAIMEKLSVINNQILAVPGNCDQAGVEKFLHSREWSVHNEVKHYNGYSFMGLGGSLPCPGKTAVEYSEEEYSLIISSLTKKINPESQKILISHQPPLNTINDRVSSGMHVGSAVIRKFIEFLQPLIVFTGHIHEGIGIDSIGNTRIVNPGPFREGNYAYTKILDGQIIDLEIRKI